MTLVYIKILVGRIVGIIGNVVFIAALASWIPQVRNSQIGYFLHTITEPIVGPVRRVLRRIPALAQLPIDFSPLVTMLILEAVSTLIMRL